MQTLVFESELRASREQLWDWITDVRCLRREMRPYILMTAPRGVRRLRDLHPPPGVPHYVSVSLLFGFLQAVGNFAQGASVAGVQIPVQFINMLPYVLTVVLLAGFIGKSVPPRAAGIPYTKDR